jgi:hypothetical protein
MSAWPGPSLRGAEGELVSIRITVAPRLLEQLLDALADLDFPINPQLYHAAAGATVEFPAWAARVREVEAALRRADIESAGLSVRDMLDGMRAVA